MSIINYHDPTVINLNLDDNGNPVSIPIQNETKQIVDGKIPLEGLPDEQYRVQITGYVEISIKDKIDSTEKFKCDYTHGVLYFDQSLNGTSINIDKYYSRGQFYMASSRIWTKIDDFGNVIETLDSAIEKIDVVVDTIENLDNTIDTANQTKQELEGLVDDIQSGNELLDALPPLISSANSSKINLDGSIVDAGGVKDSLNDSVANATTKKSELDISVGNANTINDILSNPITGTVKQANDSNASLSDKIGDASLSKSNLDGSIDNSITAKSNLDGSISTANATKIGLDDSIVDGGILKGELDVILQGADLGKMASDISNLKTDKVDNARVLTDVPVNAVFTDTIYTHPTTAGNKHIPTGGTVGQILKNTASGTATWQNETITPIANNLTETVAGKALDATQGKVLDDKIGILSSDIDATTLAVTKLEFSELSSTATNMDSEGIYKNTEWKRKNNTVYAKSALLGISPNYNQIKMDYYDELGTTVIKSITWGLTYDGNDFVYKKDVI